MTASIAESTEKTPLPLDVGRLVAARSISAVGSRLTVFAMDVWVFEATGSFNTFIVLAFLAAATSLAVAPKAGALVDASHKGRVLILSEAGALLVVVASLLALRTNSLSVAFVAVATVLLTVTEIFRWAALETTVIALTPKSELRRVNGLMEAYRSAAMMAGPLLGAVALATISLQGIFICDIATFAVSLWLMKGLWSKAELAIGDRQARSDLSAAAGLAWLMGRRDLLRLLAFFALTNCGFAILMSTKAPYILSVGSPAVLAVGIAATGVGTFLGGRFFGRMRSGRDMQVILLAAVAVESLASVMLGATTSPAGIAWAMLLMGMAAATANAANQTIWQLAVPFELQGRVMSARWMVALATPPLALLSAIPLRSNVFEPLIQRSSQGAGSWVTAVWGNHPGSAAGLMMSCLAMLIALSSLVVGARGGFRIHRAAVEAVPDGQP